MFDRRTLSESFLTGAGWPDAARRPLAEDASFRHYERIERDGSRAVLMDAPPPQEDVRPFIRITDHLRDLGFSAPEIFAEDVANGFLLLEDLGDTTFTQVLANGADEEALYAAAVDLLIDLHTGHIDVTLPEGVEGYDEDKILEEAALFTDWYLPEISQRMTAKSVREEYLNIWRSLIPAIIDSGATLVLRDFHADNLMWLPDREGLAKCGLLDYQDAVAGSPIYDLMSLLEDARRDLRPGLAARMVDRYFAGVSGTDRAALDKTYSILAAQRHCKVIGIFTRLAVRDKKYDYLVYLSRVWKLLERVCYNPALSPLKLWLDQNVPTATRSNLVQQLHV